MVVQFTGQFLCITYTNTDSQCVKFVTYYTITGSNFYHVNNLSCNICGLLLSIYLYTKFHTPCWIVSLVTIVDLN
jgi:hypothetical protein